jgi:hypothetical protein
VLKKRGVTSVPALGGLCGDAHVVVLGELAAVEHGGPGVTVGLHHPLAAGPHLVAQGPARVDRPEIQQFIFINFYKLCSR